MHQDGVPVEIRMPVPETADDAKQVVLVVGANPWSANCCPRCWMTSGAALALAKAHTSPLVRIDVRLNGAQDRVEAAKTIRSAIATQVIFTKFGKACHARSHSAAADRAAVLRATG